MKSQVISITPDNTLPGQTLLTSISLTSVAINVASPPHQMNDIYLKQGNQFIYATSYNVHATSPGNLDSITVNFSIPQNAFTGLYDVHVNRYTWFQGQPSPPIDNVLLNGFFIGDIAGTIEGDVLSF